MFASSSIPVAAVVTSHLFGVYHFAHSEPFNAAGMVALAGLVGVLLTLFFPCDPGCEPFVSVRGTLHIFIAIPMGFAILIGIWRTGRRLRGEPALARYAFVTAGLGFALAFGTVALAETALVGLAERALTWSYLQWYAVTGLLVAHRVR